MKTKPGESMDPRTAVLPQRILHSSNPARNSVARTGGTEHASPLELTLHGPDAQPQILTHWRDLEHRLGGSPLACSEIWTATWLKHYGDVVRPWFVVARRGGAVRGIALLSEVRRRTHTGLSYTALHLGTAGEPHGSSVCVEYNDLLVEDEDRFAFVTELQRLLENESGWDAFHLDGIPVTAELAWPMLAETSPAVTARPVAQTEIRVRESRYYDLEKTRQENQNLLSTLGKSTRSNLRRRLKQVGPLEIDWADSLGAAEDIFSELVELHQARWQAVDQPGAFASQQFHSFQYELIQHLHPSGQVVLARIRAAATTVGCLYLLVDRNRLLDYVSGFISFDDFPSPGLLSHYVCMEDALRRGFDAYDFLVGEKRHKENLGKSAAQLQWVVCERACWAHWWRDRMRTGKRWLKPLKRLRAGETT